MLAEAPAYFPGSSWGDPKTLTATRLYSNRTLPPSRTVSSVTGLGSAVSFSTRQHFSDYLLPPAQRHPPPTDHMTPEGFLLIAVTPIPTALDPQSQLTTMYPILAPVLSSWRIPDHHCPSQNNSGKLAFLLLWLTPDPRPCISCASPFSHRLGFGYCFRPWAHGTGIQLCFSLAHQEGSPADC